MMTAVAMDVVMVIVMINAAVMMDVEMTVVVMADVEMTVVVTEDVLMMKSLVIMNALANIKEVKIYERD